MERNKLTSFTGRLNGVSYPLNRINQVLPLLNTNTSLFVHSKDDSYPTMYGDLNFVVGNHLTIEGLLYNKDSKSLERVFFVNTDGLTPFINLVGVEFTVLVLSRELTYDEALLFDGYELEADLFSVSLFSSRLNKIQILTGGVLNVYQDTFYYKLINTTTLKEYRLSHSKGYFDIVDKFPVGTYSLEDPRGGALVDFLTFIASDFYQEIKIFDFPAGGK